ncbi:glycosyltransferase family 2 protein [Saccharospirillum mangrovi]|uniref:glycosyltransferase family 2 protein n=1 Tax=Saccharospirillum mangrovi TaxID=2161747 RepID=UPI000D3D7A2A|nr:glycosyltransferase family 2 protein [Saccharospirillum mangrovi]
MNIRVVAVVVTFNRKCELMNCLRHLDHQSRPVDRIIVIDNASRDGTEQALQQHGWLEKPQLRYLKLPTNSGGAGGFHRGISEAMREGADAIWLMDDDGYPPQDCLEKLLQHYDRYDFYGPMVVDEQQRLSFPLRLTGERQPLRTVQQVQQRFDKTDLHDVLIPFNGVVLKRSLVERIGLPRRDYFIWGDDIEYRLRAHAAGARIATLSDCQFFHPLQAGIGRPMLFGQLHFNQGNSPIKIYCQSRNGFSNARRYQGRLSAALFAIKQLWFYSLTQPNRRHFGLALRGLFDSWRGDFTRHTRLLES